VYEWIHSGAIGHVTEAHTWSNRPIWPQGMGRPEEVDEVPASLNWDVWLGPAPLRPFKANVYHRFNWRGWWDFGAGALGDMACHTMDGVHWALDPGHPDSIEPVALSPITAEAFPNASMIKWEFPRKGRRRAFTSYWYDGGLKPEKPEALELARELPTTGNLFIGTKGTLLVSGDYGNSPRIIPESRMKEIGKPPQLLERSPGHIEEWVLASRGEKPLDFPKSSFSYAGPFSEMILLGNVALRVGRRIEWDGPNMQVTNLPEANQYINKEYRQGWRF
jgi:predicted dehydrogenase